MSASNEKRKYPRLENRFTLKYKDMKNLSGEARGTVAKNISENGIRFRTDRFIALACRLVLELNIPAIKKPIKVVSKIAWIRKLPAGDDYEVGNQFLEISREDREHIRSLVGDNAEPSAA